MTKTFLEIGTCDFDTLLPLCRNGWKGYFVEPIAEYALHVIEECSKINCDASVTCCAISNFDGEVEMWKSLEDGDWKGMSHICEQKGSTMLAHDANQHLKKEKIKVPCLKLDTYLDQMNITHLDYLKMDVEGHETDIIEAYSWRVKPTFIKMEHFHIDDINMKKILEEQGYIVYKEQADLYAVM